MEILQKVHEHILKTNIATLLSDIEKKHISQDARAISIYFLMNFTISPIEPFLKWYLLESNIKPEIVFGNYDSVREEVCDDSSLLYSRNFDIVVCSLFYSSNDAIFLEKLKNVELFIEDLKTLFDLMQKKSNALFLINTLLLPFYSETGLVLQVNEISRTDAILEINCFIRNYVKQNSSRYYLMDWSRYTQILGEQASIDYRYWYIYKSPFKKLFLNYYANDITKVVLALNGYSKKCLILDCDNTLWGGIIGEDGFSEIQLDNHDYPGKIFYDFQKNVLALSKRGIILAICSKNNENDVWQVFEKHPCSVLRKENFSSYRINWLDKVNNIIELSKELNIGLDSCVFVDDSDTECELVKLALPDVTVIKVPNPLYDYPSLLLKDGLFDTLSINMEDRERHLQYQQESKRKEILKNSQTIADYLKSLELVATISLMKKEEVSRIAQLTQKTNQFNLNARRYTQQQIENFHISTNSVVFSLSVKDKFGHYGTTGVLIAKRDGNKGIIDSFLMSCRILSRNLEYIFLEHCLKKLYEDWQINIWEAEYIKTEKNSQIKDFLIKAGFILNKENTYHFNMNQWEGYNIGHIRVITEGNEYA